MVVPGLNDSNSDILRLGELISGYTCIEKVELLPYRSFCEAKYKNLGIPFLYLSGGEESYISRRLGGALGNCMSLCVYEQDEFSTKAQPLLRDAKLLRDTLGL